jgi:hypothetical protein
VAGRPRNLSLPSTRDHDCFIDPGGNWRRRLLRHITYGQGCTMERFGRGAALGGGLIALLLDPGGPHGSFIYHRHRAWV